MSDTIPIIHTSNSNESSPNYFIGEQVSDSPDSEYMDELLDTSLNPPAPTQSDFNFGIDPNSATGTGILQGPGFGTSDVIPQMTLQSPQQQHTQQAIYQYPIKFEKIGRQFIVQTSPGLLNAYEQYLQVYRGKYEETIQGPPGRSSLVSQWVFSINQEKEIIDLITRIVTGQLPPPSQLVPANQVSIDLTNITNIPVQSVNQISSTILPDNYIQPYVEEPTSNRRGRKPRKAVENPTIPPSQIIASTLGTQTIQTATPSVLGVHLNQLSLPMYDPTLKEPGESNEEHEIRKWFYQYLLGLSLPNGGKIQPDTADVLSRMRNNVDVQGVEYNEIAMKILNAYLPRNN